MAAASSAPAAILCSDPSHAAAAQMAADVPRVLSRLTYANHPNANQDLKVIWQHFAAVEEWLKGGRPALLFAEDAEKEATVKQLLEWDAEDAAKEEVKRLQKKARF